MEEPERPIFSIGAVARLLGCAPATIRTWEARYGLIVPARSAGGQRLFSRSQVEQLRQLKELLDSGIRPAEAHRLLHDRGGSDHVPAVATRVLLVESREEAAEVLRQLLDSGGYDVILAPEPAEAARRAPDASLCVVDIRREDGGGIELSRALKRTGMPVIALGTDGDEPLSRDAEADAFLPLPVDAGRLFSTVDALSA